jgi:hypothetical protein
MVVLANKVYVTGDARDRTLRSLRGVVADRLGDLTVDIDVGLRHDDFPTVTVDGPDATVARNLLAEAFGVLSPEGPSEDEVGVGTLQSWDEEGITLDAGFGQAVRVPADRLGLGPGSPDQVRERFGLVQHLPMRYVVEEDVTRLADEERDRLYEWSRGQGRVNVNSSTRSEVRATVNRAGHARDIITVERLGLLEQSIICADGTDPPGLLVSIGDYVPGEMRAVIPQ